MKVFDLIPGTTPLLISFPHVGTGLPDAIKGQLTEPALTLADTDWHVDRLYDFATALGAGTIRARFSRYVIDINRRPDGQSLYPGASTTELCPTTSFDNRSLYRDGREPDAAEQGRRIEAYYRPYHAALARELSRVRTRFGYALLYDAHSIRSRVPRFFDGELASFNIGTGGGATADPALTRRLDELCRRTPGHATACNGRFKGGWITRRYGDPQNHVHAVQMELAQKTYMNEEPPYRFAPDRAARLRPTLRAVLEAMLAWGWETYDRPTA